MAQPPPVPTNFTASSVIGLKFEHTDTERASSCLKGPVSATYRNSVWCVWRDKSANASPLSAASSGSAWRLTKRFPTDDTAPTLAVESLTEPGLCPLAGELHCLAEVRSGVLKHYRYGLNASSARDYAQLEVVRREWLDLGISPPRVAGLSPTDSKLKAGPRIVAGFNGCTTALYAVFVVANGNAYATSYSTTYASTRVNNDLVPTVRQAWTTPVLIKDQANNNTPIVVNDVPGLSVSNGQLRLTYFAADKTIKDYSYPLVNAADPANPPNLETWTGVASTSVLATSSGVSVVRAPGGHLLGCIDVDHGSVVTILYAAEPAAPNTPFNWMLVPNTLAVSSTDHPALAVNGNALVVNYVEQTTLRRVMSMTAKLAAIPTSVSVWMSKVSGNLLLSELTLPGTHDACAASKLPFIDCQTLSIEEQLQAGIRYFDIRCGYTYESLLSNEPRLYAFHGMWGFWDPKLSNPLAGVPIAEVFASLTAFVQNNKTECLVVQVKLDSGGLRDAFFKDRAAQFWRDLIKLMPQAFAAGVTGQPVPVWRLDNTIPTLQEMRGRIQLIHRAKDPRPADVPNPFGIDLANTGPDPNNQWADNGKECTIKWQGQTFPRDVLITTGTQPWYRSFVMTVQDFFSVGKGQPDGWTWLSAQDAKWDAIRSLLVKARAGISNEIGTWFLNFASSTLPFPLWLKVLETSTPGDLALSAGRTNFVTKERIGINYRLRELFDGNDATPSGTILLDYCDEPEDLILSLVRTNWSRTEQ